MWRVRVTKKRSGSGGVSALFTIPKDAYEALGEPEEVMVYYDNITEALVVERARSLDIITATVLPFAPPETDSRERVAASDIPETLKDWTPRTVYIDCESGVFYARAGDIAVHYAFTPTEPGCRELVKEVAVALKAPPSLPRAKKYLLEVYATKVVAHIL